MRSLSRRRASAKALVIPLAVASLISAGEAFAQVRSTIQARARVVKAGPAWAAREAVLDALAVALATSASFDSSRLGVIFVKHGTDLDGNPVPRLSICYEVTNSAADVLSFADGTDPERPATEVMAGSSSVCSLAADDRVLASGEVALIARGPDDRRRFVITIEHISN